MTTTFAVDYVVTSDRDGEDVAYRARLVDAVDEAAAEQAVIAAVEAQGVMHGESARITLIEEAGPVEQHP